MNLHDTMKARSTGVFFKASFIAAVAMHLCAGIWRTGVAVAAEAVTAPRQDYELAEIVVTARNRVEALQDVPLAISAIGAAELADARVADIRDLTSLVPGLQITEQGAGFNVRPIIRGLAQINIYGTSDNNVSTFLDGVYLYNPSVINLSLFDIDRIEVVKGPVSALYGRNAFAGAINYVTPAPTDIMSAKILMSGGSQKRYDVTANVNGAIIPGVLDARVGVGYQSSNGYWSDRVTGRQLGGFEKKGVQISLLYKPTDRLNIGLLMYYAKDGADPFASALLPSTCPGGPGLNIRYCGQLPRGDELPIAVQSPRNGGQNDTGLQSEFKTAHLKVAYDLDFATLESISALSKSNAYQYVSFDMTRDGLAFPLTPGPGTANVRTFIGEAGISEGKEYSEEIRLSSNQKERLRWSVGGFFYRVDALVSNAIGMDLSTVPAGQTVNSYFTAIWGTTHGQPSSARSVQIQRTDQKSVFGSLDFDITSSLTASGELRRTNSPLSSHTISEAVFPTLTSFPVLRSTESYTSGRFTLRYKVNPKLMIYASGANGQHDGGFNSNVTLPQDLAFGPEQNKTYEVGLKATAFHSLTIDLAVFHSKLTNIQILGPASDAPANPATIYKNYASAGASGFELEARQRITSGLTVDLGFAYTNPKFGAGTFDTFSGDVANCAPIPNCASRISTFHGLPAINLSGLQIIYASKYQGNFALDAKYPVTSGWDWFGRADYAFLSRFYFGLNDYQWVGARNNVNATLGVSNRNWRLALWGKNLSNDLTPIFSSGNLRLNDFRFQDNVYLPEGRSYGASVGYSF